MIKLIAMVLGLGLGLSGSAFGQEVSFQLSDSTGAIVDSGSKIAVKPGDIKLLQAADLQFQSLVDEYNEGRPVTVIKNAACTNLMLAVKRVLDRKFDKEPVYKISGEEDIIVGPGGPKLKIGIVLGMETVCDFERRPDDNAFWTPAGPFCTDHGLATTDDGTPGQGTCK